MTIKDRLLWSVKKTGREMIPAVAGLGIGIVMSVLATNPTKWTWLFWGGALFGIMALIFSLNYFIGSKR